MPNILQPDNNSGKNLANFLGTVADKDLRSLLEDHLRDILVVGQPGSGKKSQPHRDGFFDAVEALIKARVKGKP